MRHFYRTLAIAVSAGFVAIAAAQTSTAPTSRTGQTTITSQTRPVITNPLNTTPTTRTTTRTGTARVTPVPEPSQWAMMLAGLALVGFIVRRSSKRS